RQGVDDHLAGDPPAEVGQVGLVLERVTKDGQALQVVVGSEVVETGPGPSGVLEFFDGVEGVGVQCHGGVSSSLSARAQWWVCPQLTSRHCPVIARARSEARNTAAL